MLGTTDILRSCDFSFVNVELRWLGSELPFKVAILPCSALLMQKERENGEIVYQESAVCPKLSDPSVLPGGRCSQDPEVNFPSAKPKARS